MSYFKNTVAYINGNKKLRGPQREAYIAAYEFFCENDKGEALIVLPTGTGKSGLISVLPYGISNGRVLVITPGLITKQSVIKTLNPLEDNFWINYDIIFAPEDMPVVVEYDADVLDESLEKSNFVVANIHKLYKDSENSLLNRVPRDFFDMIIVDEAHHSAANSWRDVLNYFGNTKKIHLTGTPYRGDDEPIPGENIHTTSLATAMRLKLVKWLRKSTVNSKEMYFCIPNNSHKFTKEEVLEFKEAEWIQRSVALSKECSELVIDESINKLNELKELSPSIPHKILAVACSIAHAEDVEKWYKEKGMSVVIVHSELDKEKLEENLLKIENHECNIVVSVNMLMEGYDHKYLSVLAIFRPYKSKNAFAQIIGRVLRTIPDNEITDYAIDNNAYIIYHQETGLDILWQSFQNEVEKSKVLPVKEYYFSDKEYKDRESSYANVSVGQSYSTEADSYLPEIDFNEKFEEAKREIEERINEKIQKLGASGLSKEDIELFKDALRNKEFKNEKDKMDRLLVEKRPETARTEIRTFLYNTANDAAQDILTRKNIDPKGHSLYNSFKNMVYIKSDTNNDAIIVIYINTRLKNKFGAVKSRTPEQLLQSKRFIEVLVKELDKML
ncbi:MAG: DEAD/DEAH box helicase family protein [Lachnospiraceae bacterium]|nr:DEAD/DEAH box helicase family protein [Lachnospiraceae bacterium]